MTTVVRTHTVNQGRTLSMPMGFVVRGGRIRAGTIRGFLDPRWRDRGAASPGDDGRTRASARGATATASAPCFERLFPSPLSASLLLVPTDAE